MNLEQAFADCEEAVRAHDPDRYFSALFAPAARRPFLFALYAFNHELARVAETVREPMLGAIRLEWWRETVETAKQGAPRPHAVARALAVTFAACDLPLAPFEALIAARHFDSPDAIFADFAALEDHVDAISGSVMRLAARILGSDADMRAAGLAYGLAGLLRALPFHASRNKFYLPMDLLGAVGLVPEELFSDPGGEKAKSAIRQVSLRARDHWRAAHAQPRPRGALPAMLPASLVPLYLKRIGRSVSIHRRQMALLGAAMRGRI